MESNSNKISKTNTNQKEKMQSKTIETKIINKNLQNSQNILASPVSNKQIQNKDSTDQSTSSGNQTINWKELNSKLPVSHSTEDKEKRKVMFRKFDPNGNG
jgi:hypothetical protein